MTALPTAIGQALDQGQCSPDRVETAVLHMGNDVQSALEWYQVKRKIWPEEPEPEEFQRKMEELSPQTTIGDTGAAALPLSLAIACSRFDFDFAPVERILVCDAGHGPARGVVYLKKPGSQ
jgi:3-hydroxy-3-methylglutaryl CoA synthase